MDLLGALLGTTGRGARRTTRGRQRATLAAVVAVVVALGAAMLDEGTAAAQACITCRTEKCPRKSGLTDWCGQGRDPLAPKKKAVTSSPPASPGTATVGRAPKPVRLPKGRFPLTIESSPLGAVATLRVDLTAAPPIVTAAKAAKAAKGKKTKAPLPELDRVCTTPCRMDVPAGRYHLTLALAGWRTVERDLEVTGSQTVMLALEKEHPPATLEVLAADRSAAGAKASIDGATPAVLPLARELAAGRHTVVVTRPDYLDLQEAVVLDEGERRALRVALKPRPRVGTLVVAANVDGVEVWVDGQRRDVAPVVIGELGEGVHLVEARKLGYQAGRQEVTIASGEQAKLTFKLLPVGAPRPLTPEEQKALEARRAEEARLAAERRARERKRQMLKDILLHPFSFTFQPLVMTVYGVGAQGDKGFGTPGTTRIAFPSVQLSMRVLWIEGDIGAVQWTETQNALVRWSVGLSPITLGTWIGDPKQSGVTLLEPFVLYRRYEKLSTATARTHQAIVVGNRFVGELGPVGIGVEVSGEFGLDNEVPNAVFDWALNVGLMLRVGSR